MLIALGGALFGPIWGLFYSWIGVLASAVLCYRLGEKGGRLATKILREREALIARVEKRLSRHSLGGILLVRAIPLFPFNLVSVLAGAFRLRFWPYLLATAVGILPGLLLYVLLGQGVAGFLDQWLKTYFLRM